MSLSKNKGFLNIVFVGMFFLFGISEGFSQREYDPEMKPPIKDRLYYGGNFAAQFGTITFIDVSPLVGIMLTEKFSGGVGMTYQYFNNKRFPGGDSNLYGGRTFLRYNVFPNIFAHTEYEALNFDLYNNRTEVFERQWVPSLFVGAGYFAPFGNRGGANFTFLYNLLYDNQRSPYNEPYVIRVGFVL
ncbi:hypothetical protein P872_24120 [Rhodonellum psychrophilum GCM71 = DSM 17998]|uniref:Outer membrane protein beta-barrel domain-containing protein n=2 Tax=Rhodonellum TaxID=336827 RepID=U5C4Q3_9BACT|nr:MULTISPECIES: hypothetical protein [Rhodonellum]ERM84799.1 hypothetical protein P872_24120 [Rhodonellum psychrophilum GCM71 = DSM 17998]SDZ11111.1 hypothetical protein SAMN05444412_10616 [Rhodonellum ikkaensis]